MNISRSMDSTNALQNSTQFIRNQNASMPISRPVLPPRPSSQRVNSYSMPYSLSSYNSYGGNFSGYGSPYGSSPYGAYRPSFGQYNSYGMMDYQNYSRDDYERRFIQSAEESSRQTFASIESVVRAFNSLAMMLDNTFFAMTSSFRAILGVAENFGRLRTMFGDIWYSVNIFRFVTWLYRKIRQMMGLKVPHSPTSLAWKEATHGAANGAGSGKAPGSSWPTLAFLGVIVSAPYILSKFIPKYEDKLNPANWKSPGIKAKACFDFVATSPNELTIHTNDSLILAPTYLQEEMNLRNTGWAYAVHNGSSGVVPLNYIVINKNNSSDSEKVPVHKSGIVKEENERHNGKSHTKRVSFGDIQIFEGKDVPPRNESLPPENKTS